MAKKAIERFHKRRRAEMDRKMRKWKNKHRPNKKRTASDFLKDS